MAELLSLNCLMICEVNVFSGLQNSGNFKYFGKISQHTRESLISTHNLGGTKPISHKYCFVCSLVKFFAANNQLKCWKSVSSALTLNRKILTFLT